MSSKVKGFARDFENMINTTKTDNEKISELLQYKQRLVQEKNNFLTNSKINSHITKYINTNINILFFFLES